MIVRLDFPLPELFPNRRFGRHGAAIAPIVARVKYESYMLARKAKVPKLDPAKFHPLSIVFVTPSDTTRDLDGMLGAMKPALDGLARALGIDDSKFKPILLDWQRGEKPGCVMVAIDVSLSQAIDLP